MIGCSETLDLLHGATSSNPTIHGDATITSLTRWDSLLGVMKITFIIPKDD